MIRYCITALLLLATLPALAQICNGCRIQQGPIPTITLPQPDVSALAREDAEQAHQQGQPWRFGAHVPVQLSQNDFALFGRLGPRQVWVLNLAANGAQSLNFAFDKLTLPEGWSLRIDGNANESQLIKQADVAPSGRLATHVFYTNLLKLTLIGPSEAYILPQLQISSIVYGYRTPTDYLRGFGDSGPCQVNTACPQADPWRQQVRSVCTILVGGNAFCTGALVNNTCENERPFVLTANHCLDGNEDLWVFRFNWESPDCAATGQSATNQIGFGALVRAANPASDMALVELYNPIPDSYNAVFAGWDASGTVPDSVAMIHHPSGDVKKIAIDRDSVLSTSWNNVFAWKVLNWEVGVSEPGSSGAPLFDPQGRIIGQHAGGSADCGNPNEDYFGRMDVSWDQGTSAATQLAHWLDGCATNQQHIAAFPPSPVPGLDAACHAIRNVDAQVCGDTIEAIAVIRNNGLDTIFSGQIEYQLDANPPQTIGFSGNVLSGEKMLLNLPPMAVNAGSHTVTVSVTSVNLGNDQNAANNTRSVSFTTEPDGLPVRLRMQLDDFASETSWQLRTSTNSVLYQGGPYQNAVGGQWVETKFCLQPDCYNFRVLDSYGDGMNGSASGGLINGNFELLDRWDQPLAALRDTNFGFQELHYLCPSPTCQEGLPVPEMWIQAVGCKGESTGEVTANILEGIPPYSYVWSDANQQTGSSTDDLPTGDYFVTVTDSMACTYVGHAFVPEPDSALSFSYTVVDATDTAGDGSIALSVSGGAAPYTFSWQHGPATQALDSLKSGWYVVAVSDSGSCVVSDSIYVAGPNALRELLQATALQLLPNPARLSCVVRTTETASKPRITDVHGRFVPCAAETVNNGWLLDLQHLAPGIYIVQVGSAAARLVVLE